MALVDVAEGRLAKAMEKAARKALDEALDTLERLDPRKVRVIELRFFGGLTVKETAAVLKISAQSVMRDWKLAKAWVLRELTVQG